MIEHSSIASSETKGRGVLALYGRSGAGKSTLLRAIAGLTSPSASKGSRVSFAGDVWQAEGTFKAAELRGVGLVFQDQQLLPHLSVGESSVRIKKGPPTRGNGVGGGYPSNGYRYIT